MVSLVSWVSLVVSWRCSGRAAGVVVVVVAGVLLSGYFGCKHLREFFDLEVLPDFCELFVAAFEDEVAERIGYCRYVAARAAFRYHFAADRVLVWVSCVLLAHSYS